MSLFTPPELSQEVRAPLVNKINRQGDVLFKKKVIFAHLMTPMVDIMKRLLYAPKRPGHGKYLESIV